MNIPRFCALAGTLLLCFILPSVLLAAGTPDASVEGGRRPAVPLLMKDPVPLSRVELAPEALAVWRTTGVQKPTLLLLSDIPMITPIPKEIRKEVLDFVKNAGQEDLFRRGLPGAADLLIHPDMTVDAALRAGWLGHVAWALPLRDPERPLDSEAFRKMLLEGGVATEEEAKSLSGSSHLLAGKIQGVPWDIGALGQLPPITGPVIVHIDQSFFQNVYKNDVSTPILALISETLAALRERNLSVVAATFCYGNMDDRIALDVRFIGELLSSLVENPASFDVPVADVWKRQSNVLYLSNFFQREKVQELAAGLAADFPDRAWPKFDLYRLAIDYQDGVKAIDYLSKAVARDRVYAMEYLALADMAYRRSVPADALKMLRLASAALPENAQIGARMVSLYRELGDGQSALAELKRLRALPWSSLYYPGMIRDIDLLIAELSPPAASPRAENENGIPLLKGPSR